MIRWPFLIPHLHALYAEHEALIDVRTLEVIGGSLPRRALNRGLSAGQTGPISPPSGDVAVYGTKGIMPPMGRANWPTFSRITATLPVMSYTRWSIMSMPRATISML